MYIITWCEEIDLYFYPHFVRNRPPSGCLALCHYASLMNLVPDSDSVARLHTLLYFGCHRPPQANNEDLRLLWNKHATKLSRPLNDMDHFNCGHGVPLRESSDTCASILFRVKTQTIRICHSIRLWSVFCTRTTETRTVPTRVCSTGAE